ncbi:MAG TPA: M43 family zinc metalloprotease [Bacteroidia bacterium]
MFILIRKVSFSLVFMATYCFGFSQVNKQSNNPPNKADKKLNSSHVVQQPASTTPLKCLNKKLSLAIHIVTDSLNHTNITQAQINTGLTTLNTDFTPICLSFFICKQDTIYNYEYYKFQNPKHIAQAENTYEIPNMINIYVVGSIIPPIEAGFAGKDDNIMVLSHACITDGKCWSHEMGHYFSLAHTFDTSGGLEFVNESNCLTAGDSICDTPADINPAPINGTCQWTGNNTDPHGAYYTPIIGNIMSYHPANCKTPFTVGQLNKMLNWYISYRNYLH